MIFQALYNSINSFFRFKDMHVRITDKGRELLNDKKAGSALVQTILKRKKELDEGKAINIKGTNYSVKSTTSIKEKL